MVVRHLTPLGVAVILAMAPIAPPHMAAQTGSSSKADWQISRTPWGDPDLQGVWTTDWERGVPLERPTELGEQAELTAEGIAARSEQSRVTNEERRQTRPLSEPVEPEIWFEVGKVPSASDT